MFTKSKFKFAFEQFFFVLRIGRLLWFEIPEDEEMPTAAQLLDEKAKGRIEIREASEIEKTELGQVLKLRVHVVGRRLDLLDAFLVVYLQ